MAERIANQASKFAKMITPFWKRKIDKYPLYVKGDPQLRILRPKFWMKMVRPQLAAPDTHLTFVVHPQMTRHDVRNYLEKIYEVRVVTVSTELRQSDPNVHEKSYTIEPDEDYKVAYVTVVEEDGFKFPDLFKGKKLASDSLEEAVEELQPTVKKTAGTSDVPTWYQK